MLFSANPINIHGHALQLAHKYCITANVLFLQVWRFLLELKCPSSVEHDWHKIFKNIVVNFLKTLPSDICVRLFLELESDSAANPLVIDIFMTEVTSALDELFLNKVSKSTVCCKYNRISIAVWSLYSQYN